MQNEKFKKTRDSIQRAIKSAVQERVKNGLVKSVEFVYDKESNLVCIVGKVSMCDDPYLKSLERDLRSLVIDTIQKTNANDDWFGLFLPDIVVTPDSAVSTVHSLVLKKLGGR